MTPSAAQVSRWFTGQIVLTHSHPNRPYLNRPRYFGNRNNLANSQFELSLTLGRRDGHDAINITHVLYHDPVFYQGRGDGYCIVAYRNIQC